MDAMLEAAGAAYRLPGGRTLFSGLSFTLAPGEVLCVLGPNGIGKSTLLRCLAGQETLAAGEIRLDGRPLPALSRRAIGQRLGVVPQSDAPVFAFTVREVVEMGRAPHLGWLAAPGPADRAVAQAALEKLGVAGLAGRLYPELSGGERQLVLIARALAQQPRALLLDEPTSHLDFANAMRVLELVRGLAREGLAVVMTSHNPEHAFLVAGQSLIMAPPAGGAAGQAAAWGPTATLLTEARLSAVYGRPVRLAEVAGRRLCYADWNG